MSGIRRVNIPSQAFRQRTQVKSYEVGQDGRLRAGNLLRYLEWVATQASASVGFAADWYLRQGTAWVVREMDVSLGALPPVATDLEMATWVADFKRVQALREYAVWCVDSGLLVARAHARWAYVDRVRGVPVRLPDELSSAFEPLGHEMAVRARILSDPDGRPSELRLTAREYEADSQLHINNCVYADWLGEAFSRATESTQNRKKRLAPHYLRIEYVRPAIPGAHIRIESNLMQTGSRRIHADQIVRDDRTDQVYVRAHSEYLELAR